VSDDPDPPFQSAQPASGDEFAAGSPWWSFGGPYAVGGFFLLVGITAMSTGNEFGIYAVAIGTVAIALAAGIQIRGRRRRFQEGSSPTAATETSPLGARGPSSSEHYWDGNVWWSPDRRWWWDGTSWRQPSSIPTATGGAIGFGCLSMGAAFITLVVLAGGCYSSPGPHIDDALVGGGVGIAFALAAAAWIFVRKGRLTLYLLSAAGLALSAPSVVFGLHGGC
jgi:hypothetical protein